MRDNRNRIFWGLFQIPMNEMKDSNRNNSDLGEEILDKITDAMEALDCEKMIENIRTSVGLIQNEADKGYKNLQNAADAWNATYKGSPDGANQSWFSDGGGQTGEEESSFANHGTYYDSMSAHKASSGEYSYHYSNSGDGPHRASSGQYTRDPYNKEENQKGTLGSKGTNAPKGLSAVVTHFPGNVSSIVELCLGAAGMPVWLLVLMLGLLVRASGGLLIFLLILLAVHGGLIWNGISKRAQISRLKKYNKVLQGKDYCMLADLARSTYQSEEQVLKDMKLLLEKNCMPGVTMDKNETCLMLTDEARKQYENAEYARIQRELEEAHQKAMEEAEALKKASATKEEKAFMKFDEAYKNFYADLTQIRAEMDTPVMKEHVEKIDALLTKVYDCVKEHNEMIGNTGHLTSYYFPCMSKLFHTYLDLEEQPIQGENIQKTRAEIEGSFDTIEAALTNMYDEMFTNISMDIASDISVLKTMMARDGWSETQMKADNADQAIEEAMNQNSFFGQNGAAAGAFAVMPEEEKEKE